MRGWPVSRFKREWIITNQYGRPYPSGYHLNLYLDRAHVATGLRRRRGPYPWRHTYASIGAHKRIEPGVPREAVGAHERGVRQHVRAMIESDGDRRQRDLAERTGARTRSAGMVGYRNVCK